MRAATRRDFLRLSAVTAAATAVAAACAPPPRVDPVPSCGPPPTGPPGPMPEPGSVGLIDEAAFQGRVDEYLAFATDQLRADNPTSIAAHLIRARRDPSFQWDPSQVTVEGLAPVWQKIDDWKDTRDFDVMYLHWVLALGRDVLDPSVIAAIEDRLVAFRYRWDDPLPPGRIDHLWFWSENHRIIVAVDEYLAGLALPDRTFEVTGLTGAEHAARARPVILEWIDERARFGFAEWHSNVYMLKNITPLLTLVELCDDEELIRLGSAALDLCLADVAMHLQRGAYGATRGRTYKKDKMSSLDEATWSTAKLLFDDTAEGYTSRTDTGATYFCGAQRYRMPEVLARIARSDEVSTSKERHGVPIDPHEAYTPNPQAPYGYDYDDDANIPFWWSLGALTSWQVVPATLRAADRFRLWETDLFSDFAAIRQLTEVGPTVAQLAARELAPMAAFGVLGEAHTYTWRSPEVMLSTVVHHRPGDKRDQAHAWQATIDHDALVFTTHPSKPTPQSLDWREDDGYWTGSASMPRSVQHHNVAIHLYAPAYHSPDDPLLGPIFGYLQETHAYFPQDHFDEVVQEAGWTIGRKGDGYVALWSERPTTWRTYDPEVVATRGMEQPFDLVAEGSAHNTWVVEVARRADAGAFADFVERITTAEIAMDRSTPGDPRLRYVSPSQGELRYSPRSGLTVEGEKVPVGGHPRLESPWGDVCHLGKFLALRDGDRSLVIDFDKGAREVG
ncbi:MAG TPA: twin-arginine translocation signal domain-containing protein [Microthrixaceae bacterium]|nr:twin-arginine translocation signal domain-containing protein [Microthrixaceae bacterium]